MSKDKKNSQYPKEGDVRIITIQTALKKLYEHVIHHKLKEELGLKPLHDRQRGFVEGKCSHNNTADIINILSEVKGEIKKEAAKEIRKRPKRFLVIVDIKKAFDSVNRAQALI